MSTLYMDLAQGDLLQVGDGMLISVVHKSGSRVRLKLMGPDEVKLMRAERAKPQPTEVHATDEAYLHGTTA